MSFDAYKGVLVFIEQRNGVIQKVSLELLGKGKELADKLGEKLIAVILGSGITDLADELVYQGANEVVVVDDPLLLHYVTEPYTKALCAVLSDKKPDIVLLGATAIGRDLGPRVSARLHTGLTADCTSLEIDEDTRLLLMTRPAFGGNIMATIICPDHKPQMSTVRPGVMKKALRNTNLSAIIEMFDTNLVPSDMNVEVLEVVKEDKKRINIEDAVTLISAGRGIGSKEGVSALYSLASELKGEVSGSRAVIDLGWLDKDRQVGQTGKTVRPNLYVACGISGAIQHVAGMEESEFIVAINKNPEAPIFEVADLGIVGDVNKVLNALVEEIRSSKND
jgi:electron transfer flavoprotein alpha subunit